MAAWSGRGIPPTRRKLHRWRQAQLKLRQETQGDSKSENARRQHSWNKRTRGSIINPERFEQLWG